MQPRGGQRLDKTCPSAARQDFQIRVFGGSRVFLSPKIQFQRGGHARRIADVIKRSLKRMRDLRPGTSFRSERIQPVHPAQAVVFGVQRRKIALLRSVRKLQKRILHAAVDERIQRVKQFGRFRIFAQIAI